MSDDFGWDDLLDFIEAGKVVPVLGQELVHATYQGADVSLQRVLAEALAKREGLDVPWVPYFELNDAVSAYLAKPQARLVGLHDRVGSLLKALTPPFPVPEGLRRLAAIPPLDLFVTLTFDSCLARALDLVRHGGASQTREIDFSVNQSTAAQTAALQVRPEDGPIVFHLFGRAAGKSDFALHDEDQLEFVHRLVSGDVAPPEWLFSELRNRHLLILGVHVPDWLGRFILRAATRDRLRMSQRAYFVARDHPEAGATLTDFLRRFGRETRIDVFDGPADAFVVELLRRWHERHPTLDAPAPAVATPVEQRRCNIFISYGRENLAAVERLHAAITTLGGDVWFDRAELTAGDAWERAILPRIQRDVRLFVPVISSRTADRQEGYVFREWREAFDRAKRIVGRKFILPVVVDPDYGSDADRYRSLVDAFPELQALHFGRAPDGDPDGSLMETLKQEIRAMRREEASA
jgi:TIR domain/SIR2-like domain